MISGGPSSFRCVRLRSSCDLRVADTETHGTGSDGMNAFAFTDARELLMRGSGNLSVEGERERERDSCVTDNTG